MYLAGLKCLSFSFVNGEFFPLFDGIFQITTDDKISIPDNNDVPLLFAPGHSSSCREGTPSSPSYATTSEFGLLKTTYTAEKSRYGLKNTRDLWKKDENKRKGQKKKRKENLCFSAGGIMSIEGEF